MTTNETGKFYYAYSCDLDINVQIKIGTLEGKFPKPKHTELIEDPMLYFSNHFDNSIADFYVTCQILNGTRELSLPTKTSYKSFTTRWNWNEWLELPIKYNELTRDSLLTLSIYHVHQADDQVFAGTSVPLFSKTGVYRQGMYDLKVWPKRAGGHDTPGKAKSSQDEMSRIYKLCKDHRNGRMMKVDWMDRLTFREIEMMNERAKRLSEQAYLMIEFPRLQFRNLPDVTVIYYEKNADNVVSYPKKNAITTIYDPDLEEKNLLEDKHYRLARSLRAGLYEKELKPSAVVRDRLMALISYPPTKPLTPEDKDLIWRFRFYLSSHEKALVKFLRSVQWRVHAEVAQALHLLPSWSPVAPADALELLTPSFSHPSVRRYAVARLTEADDEDLLLYTLQLVQALKYENSNKGSMQDEALYNEESRLKSLGWVEEEEKVEELSRTTSSNSSTDLTASLDSNFFKNPTYENMDLADFLITKACRYPKLANYLYWYLKVESVKDDDENVSSTSNKYKSILNKFLNALSKGPKEWQQTKTSFEAQEHFLARIVAVVKAVARETGNRLKKIAKLQHLLKENDLINGSLTSFEPLPLLLDPDIKVKGIEVESATLFKSALMPCKLTFKVCSDNKRHPSPGSHYVAIFKHGDDLRQDQLVLQIIQLIDKLLKRENLDLKLTPYKVIATNSRHGFVQYIDSTSVAEILSNDASILNYFRRVAPSEQGPMGVQPEVIRNYVKSCAGYCIITYLLAVGDRHFDNLLITKTGKLFHIDFGFILGREPKPMQPPMKLSREMVEAMGGVGSVWWAEFKQLCYTAFLHLRRSSSLILNLFSLMLDANVPDIALEPDKTVKKVQDRFQLGLTDEEAVQCIQNMIDISISATAAAFIEQMHKFTQYLKK